VKETPYRVKTVTTTHLQDAGSRYLVPQVDAGCHRDAVELVVRHGLTVARPSHRRLRQTASRAREASSLAGPSVLLLLIRHRLASCSNNDRRLV